MLDESFIISLGEQFVDFLWDSILVYCPIVPGTRGTLIVYLVPGAWYVLEKYTWNVEESADRMGVFRLKSWKAVLEIVQKTMAIDFLRSPT